MATLQIRLDDSLKKKADNLFTDLGLDTPTAVRIFLSAAINSNGIPFVVKRRGINVDMEEAIKDTRLRQNLSEAYSTGEEAINAALKEGEDV